MNKYWNYKFLVFGIFGLGLLGCESFQNLNVWEELPNGAIFREPDNWKCQDTVSVLEGFYRISWREVEGDIQKYSILINGQEVERTEEEQLETFYDIPLIDYPTEIGQGSRMLRYMIRTENRWHYMYSQQCFL